MSEKKQWNHPNTVFEEYKQGQNYKDGLGARGLYEQNRINQRFYEGDQWYGVQCGDKKALVRYNIIRRAGKYMQAMVDGKPLAINFSAEGVPCTQETRDRVGERKKTYREESVKGVAHVDEKNVPNAEQVGLLMDVLGNYHKTTAERLRFDTLKSRVLERSFVTGTGLLYTYWDDGVKTGQFADEGKKEAIRGDIACEVLDVENVYFGDPTLDDVQAQPYIIIAQRRSVEELKREARRSGRPTRDIEAIKADGDTAYMAGARETENEPTDSRKATVLTKLYKAYGKDGNTFKVMAVRVVEGATIRTPWDTKLCCYPISKFSWGESPNRIYGYSEVTHLIPNQIAINRAATASVDAVMKMGMPMLLYDADVIRDELTNEPGQAIPVYGMPPESPVRYVAPQNFTPQFSQLTDSVMGNTMNCLGANDAALGDMRPDNTSAILALREITTLPLQLLQNHWYAFVEETARIWLDFWVHFYGKRALKMMEEEGEWYFPFDAAMCDDLIINVRVDVGPANMWSEIASLQTLDALFQAGIIDAWQYVTRLPKGSVPEQTSLIREIKEKVKGAATAQEGAVPPTGGADAGGAPATDPKALIGMMSPEHQEKFNQLPPEEQAQIMAQLQGAM
ncbi:MAG: hypothetical protein IJB36_04005 [Clostridia bacterium]|nr:hypothetical protein [Clostridia bacterium]